MVTIEKIRKLHASANGIHNAVLDLNVSTVAELPNLGATVEGTTVMANSYAVITQTGEWYKLDDDGKWYACDGTGEAS